MIASLVTLVAGLGADAIVPIEPGGLLASIDHLVYAAPDLQAGIDRIEKLLGIRATPGGQHPGRGTRNTLLALGPRVYLEIIGPDPDQPPPTQGRPFGIDGLAAPRLVTWAVKATALEQVAGEAARRGVKLGEVTPGSRRRPDGLLLVWRYTDPRTVVDDGIVPFLIDWGSSPHPATTAASGATLVALRAEHPEPARVRHDLGQLGIDLPVQPAVRPGLVATIDGPRGRTELR